MRILTENGKNNIDRNLGIVGTSVEGLKEVSKVPPHKFFGNE